MQPFTYKKFYIALLDRLRKLLSVNTRHANQSAKDPFEETLQGNIPQEITPK